MMLGLLQVIVVAALLGALVWLTNWLGLHFVGKVWRDASEQTRERQPPPPDDGSAPAPPAGPRHTGPRRADRRELVGSGR